jgi:polysaccharide biosynthesis transport protein
MTDKARGAGGFADDAAAGMVVYSPREAGGVVRGGLALGRNPSHSVEESPVPTLRDYFEVLKRNWILAAAVLAGIFSVVAGYAFLVKPTYRSLAVLLIENNVGLVGELKGAKALMASSQISFETEMGSLRSKSLAGEVVKKLNLGESEEFLSFVGRWRHRIRRDIYSLIGEDVPKGTEKERARKEWQAVTVLEQRLTMRQRESSRLLELRMDASQPELAQTMLKTYLDLYSEAKLRRERKLHLDSLRWLKEEIQKVQMATLKSESALVKFIADSGIVPSEDGGLTEVVDTIKRKKRGVMKARELQARLEGIKENEGDAPFNAGPDVAEDEILKKLKEHLATLESDLAQTKAAYSPNSLKSQLLVRKIRDVEHRISVLQSQSVNQALKVAQREAEVLTQSVDDAKEEALRIGGLGAQYAMLKKDVETNKELHKILLKDYKETLVQSRTERASLNMIDQPSLPMDPVWPKRGLLLFVGLLLGASGSLVVVFTKHFLEGSRQTTTSLEQEFNVAKLGMVPDANKLKKFHNIPKSQFEFLSYEQPVSPLADSLRNIHASILFATLGKEEIRSVVVSSAAKGEGKTFISVSLATALTCNNSVLSSCSPRRILVVDCDMRRPSIHHVFRMVINSGGLSTLLTSDRGEAMSVIHKHDSIPGLFYMTAGPQVPDPAALLMSDRFRNVAEELQKEFDFVIFDSPPILGFPDIRILSRYSDGVILVVEEGRLEQAELRTAFATVASAPGSRILGLVLNKARIRNPQSVYGDYYYSGNGGARDR